MAEGKKEVYRMLELQDADKQGAIGEAVSSVARADKADTD